MLQHRRHAAIAASATLARGQCAMGHRWLS
jgi:hypothetical protein